MLSSPLPGNAFTEIFLSSVERLLVMEIGMEEKRERVGASIETIDFPTEVLWTEWRAVLILSFFAAMLFHFFFFILMCCGAHAILNVLDILFLCHNKL